MGFFNGLITLQAVIVLIFVALVFGCIFGIGLSVFAIEKEFPEAYKLIDQQIKKKKQKNDTEDTPNPEENNGEIN